MTATEARGDYRIEEVAARTGFTKRTLRYYEEIGLITPAGRSEGNYRLYSEADVARLQRIKRLKDVLGIPLSSLKRLAEVEETLDALGTELRGPLDPQQRRMRLLQAYAELEQQLRTIDERLATLTHMRAELADRLARIDQLLHPGDTEKLLRRRRLGWRGVERDADLIKRRVGGRQDQIRRRQGVVRQRRAACLHQAHRLP